MGNILGSPIVDKESHYYDSAGTGLKVGASGMQGWRLEMEDAHVSIDIEGAPGHMFLAVFDGHAGAGAAAFAAREIVKTLRSTSEWAEYVRGEFRDIELLGNAMTSAFIKIDVDMRMHQDASNGTDFSGCTAVTAVVAPRHVLCANAGDSRCVLGSNNNTVAMSEDHKPWENIEYSRIIKAGGFVQWNRVDGDLAVSRAFGDFGYKDASMEARAQKISCVPDIRVHVRTPEDDLLLLACDGLWDVMTSEEAVQTVRGIYESGERNPVLIAEEMLDLALAKGSKDNISAVVAILPAAEFGPESNGGVAERRRIREKAQREMAATEGGDYGDASSPSSKDP